MCEEEWGRVIEEIWRKWECEEGTRFKGFDNMRVGLQKVSRFIKKYIWLVLIVWILVTETDWNTELFKKLELILMADKLKLAGIDFLGLFWLVGSVF